MTSMAAAQKKATQGMGMGMPGMAEMQAEAERAQAEAQLGNVQITGDTAQAQATTVFQGQSHTGTINFKKIDGKWYIHETTPRGMPGM